MKPIERAVWILSAVAVAATWGLCPARAEQAQPSAAGARELFVTVGKSLVVESPVVIQRVSVANPRVAEAVVVNPKEVVVNGLAVGETSLILWQQGGNRILFDLRVRAHTGRLDAVREQLKQELAGQEVSITPEGDNVFLRGTVKDLVSAERAVTIAGTLGKPVNLLHVKVPPVEQQVLLKVRFANVDRAASSDLGANFFFPGALNTRGAITTGTFTPPRLTGTLGGGTGESEAGVRFTLTDALNVFLFRPDLNLGATIRALQSKRLLELLAEPNLLAINGKQASFLAGGEFPVPVVQAGIAGAGAISIQWREFGVRLNFVPTVTPRGTIRLQVEPEVSSLDYANAVVISGFTVPAISTRRVQTEIELESGQSFAIAGLLDNRMTESLSKIPGIGDIPLLGKLFQSRSLQKNNTELLVVVTPDVVRPIPTGQPVPGVKMPAEFLTGTAASAPQTPGMEVTGPVPVRPPQETVPVEQLQEKPGQARGAAAPGVQYIPVLPMPVQQPQAPSAPAAPQPGTPAPAAPQP